MRRLTFALAALAAVLAVPSLASAHTGSVACTDKGVVFSYNNNFANSTVVTENVNGVTKTFTVPAHTAVTDTIPAPAAKVIAGASWSDGGLAGSIPFVALAGCTAPPPVTPVICTPTTVTNTVEVPGATQYVNVPGPTTYVDRVKTKVVYRTRVKWKTRIKLIVAAPFKPVHKVRGVSAGVTG